MKKQLNSSWESSSRWYDHVVGKEGHYYHQHTIFPNLLRLFKMRLMTKCKVLDVGCGQGVLCAHLPPNTPYLGLDLSPALIKAAKKRALPQARYLMQDMTKTFTLPEKDFTDAFAILTLQNMIDPLVCMQNVAQHLIANGHLYIVLNHPCFRIPRQSSWQIDRAKKLQYRRIDCYLSPLEIPIQTKPSLGEKSQTTWSFHRPLSFYSQALFKAGFCIELIEEWASDKTSQGAHAAMENRARHEFPLFLLILAKKL